MPSKGKNRGYHSEGGKNYGYGKGDSILVDVANNNAEREGTTAVVRKYKQLVRRAKQTQVEQIILLGILPVKGSRRQGYRNCRRMAINMLVQQLCREEEVSFVDLWRWFVGRPDMYMMDGLHLSRKGAAVFVMSYQQQSTVAWEA